MTDIYEKIEKEGDAICGFDSNYVASYVPFKSQLPLIIAGTMRLLDEAHDIVSHYANSLGNPEYYDIERDEWKIGEDWTYTNNSGIQFSARVNVGRWREPDYRERYVVLPWHVLEAYINDPETTKKELYAQYKANIEKVRLAEEQKAADYKAQQAKKQEDLERQQYELLKNKFENKNS